MSGIATLKPAGGHPENYYISKPKVSFGVWSKNSCIDKCMIIPNYSLKGKMLLDVETLPHSWQAIELEGNSLDFDYMRPA